MTLVKIGGREYAWRAGLAYSNIAHWFEDVQFTGIARALCGRELRGEILFGRPLNDYRYRTCLDCARKLANRPRGAPIDANV